MGQLIKLQDYVSRYEQDIYRYPSQFVRLKRQQWAKMHAAFQEGALMEDERKAEDAEEFEETPGLLDKVRGIFKRKAQAEELAAKLKEEAESAGDEGLHFKVPYIPNDEEELKKLFLNQLFQFQMKWATSTIREQSHVSRKFFVDEKLKFLLQRFPDTFLVLYRPVFQLKKAPVETEIILLTPTATWCLGFMEDEDNAVYIGSTEKFWVKKHSKRADKKILNPLLSLQRTEIIVKKIYLLSDVEIPVKQALVTREGYIDFAGAPHNLMLLDKRGFPEWFRSMRNMPSPLKNQQLKGAEALLNYCQTSSIKRMEWNGADGLAGDLQ